MIISPYFFDKKHLSINWQLFPGAIAGKIRAANFSSFVFISLRLLVLVKKGQE